MNGGGELPKAEQTAFIGDKSKRGNVMRKLQNKLLAIVFAAAAGGALALVSTSRAFDWPLGGQKNAKASVPVVVNEAPLARDTKFTTSFSPVVKKVAPSVVNIFTTKTVKNPYGSDMSPFSSDPFFRRFFGNPYDEGDTRPQKRSHKERSLGSGVIVSKDGYILTNNHVVDGADEIKVALAKGTKEYDAKVIGRDPRTDITLLKIEAEGLSYITLADSDKVEVGDVVMAIGNPFGIGQTVTMGIVSAVGRGGFGVEDYEDFIQTDAAINPGNSGGPLVDAEGRLVGINTFIISRSGGNQGIGFAVPINLARDVMERLRKDGSIVRGYLGVMIQDLTPELAKEFDMEEQPGALVSGVTEKSAAAEAGLKSGDVIVEFNSKPIQDSRQLRLLASKTSPGTKVDVKVLRHGKEKTFAVTLKELPGEKAKAKGERDAENSSTDDALDGVEVGDITPAARRKFELPDDLKGALVTGVDPESVASEKGLKPGDVIEEINRKPITNADEAVEASKHVKNKRTLLRVWSHGGSRYVVVDESKSK
jgi:serine protease Do